MSTAVSVVMAIHNGRRFLGAQIDSVMAELHPEDEVIVIDDASTDGSGEWLASLGDRRIQLYRNESNRGVMPSFERGLGLARHAFIFLCDQDDVWLPGKRAACVAAFEQNPSALVVVTDAQLIDASGAIIAPSFMDTRGGFRGGLGSTLVRNRYLGCAMALRRELLAAALPIPQQVPMHDMWLGALGSLLGRVHYISTPLLQYRRHHSNVTPSHRQSWPRMLRWRLCLLCAVLTRLCSLAFGCRKQGRGHAPLKGPQA